MSQSPLHLANGQLHAGLGKTKNVFLAPPCPARLHVDRKGCSNNMGGLFTALSRCRFRDCASKKIAALHAMTTLNYITRRKRHSRYGHLCLISLSILQDILHIITRSMRDPQGKGMAAPFRPTKNITHSPIGGTVRTKHYAPNAHDA